MMQPTTTVEENAPRPRKGRRPSHIGTCQICGKRYVVTEAVTPPVIRAHGYDTIKGRTAMRVPCGGSGQQPLEFDSSHTALTLRFVKAQLADLLERQAAIEAGTGPPPGLSGLNALKVRFSNGAEHIAEKQRMLDRGLAIANINRCNREINLLTRLLVTRDASGMLPTLAQRGSLPRIGDLFRCGDGRLYTVESTIPVPAIARHSTRCSIRAPHYLCRSSDGSLHRFLQATITRALNSQGGSLPRIGRPTE